MITAFNEAEKPLRASRVHIVGAAYKKDIDDVRESPALDIIAMLQRRGAVVTYSDPYVKSLTAGGTVLWAQPLGQSLEVADCAVIITDHSGVDYSSVVRLSKLIVDTRNATRQLKSEKIIRL